jgi:hypothetical protein
MSSAPEPLLRAAFAVLLLSSGCGAALCPGTPYVPPRIGLWLEQSSGQLAEQASSAFMRAPLVPPLQVVADLNEDGHADLAMSTDNDGTSLCLFFGDGAGALTPAACPAGEGGTSSGLTLGDFNVDRHLDFAEVRATSGTIRLWLGKGDGAFTQTEISVAQALDGAASTGDFDADGKTDLAVLGATPNSYGLPQTANTLFVLLGNGDGTFQTPVAYVSTTDLTSLAVGDFDGDGRSDVAVLSAADDASTAMLELRTAGTHGALSEPKSIQIAEWSGTPVRVGDFDGDQRLDLLLAGSGRSLGFLPGNSDGTPGPERTIEVPGGTDTALDSVWMDDLNADGKLDLVVTGMNIDHPLLLGKGDGTFEVSRTTSPAPAAVGDFNADGRADLVILTPSSGGTPPSDCRFQPPSG